MLLQMVGVAVLAAALALVGNHLLLRARTNTQVRQERRAFVRQLHPATVDVVVDLDDLVGRLRANAVVGPVGERGSDVVDRLVASRWEGDLQPRLRQLEFGHPDAEVRRAAERVGEAMWPYIGAARDADAVDDERRHAIRTIEGALAELKDAVYAAPNRDVPQPDFQARAFLPPSSAPG